MFERAALGRPFSCSARSRSRSRSQPSARTIDAGESVRGRAIVAKRQGNEDAPTRVLAIGQIHGDEPGGLRVIRALRGMRAPRGVALWTVRSVNPDGARLGIRQNVRGIDLNRNFPRGWRPSAPGSRYYGGRRPLSQPESRAAARLIRRLQPRDHDLVPPAVRLRGEDAQRGPAGVAALRAARRDAHGAAAEISGHGHPVAEPSLPPIRRLRGRAARQAGSRRRPRAVTRGPC